MSGRPQRGAERFSAGVAWESFGDNNVCWIGPDQTRWVPSDWPSSRSLLQGIVLDVEAAASLIW